MSKEIISKFKEKPKTKIGWRVLYLGLSAFFIPLFLVTFNTVIRLWIDRASVNPNRSIGIPMGFASAVLALVLSIYAIIVSIRAFKIGERSWVVWLGFIPSVLIALFWSFMFVGELIFPH
jgi:uncharacterized membrane protein (DUF485 family)